MNTLPTRPRFFPTPLLLILPSEAALPDATNIVIVGNIVVVHVAVVEIDDPTVSWITRQRSPAFLAWSLVRSNYLLPAKQGLGVPKRTALRIFYTQGTLGGPAHGIESAHLSGVHFLMRH